MKEKDPRQTFFKTLYSKLALVLFVFTVFSGGIFLYAVQISAEQFHQEITQKLNLSLAKNIAKEALLLEGTQINRPALDKIFHMLMVINPNIEVYLLNNKGKILAYSAKKEKIKREFVELAPVLAFINNQDEEISFPYTADDPRDPKRKKIFSAAPISAEGLNEGYLYVILGGEKFDNVVAMLRESHSLRTHIIGLMASLCIAFIAGLLSFGLFTRRLKILSEIIKNYTKSRFTRSTDTRYPRQNLPRDEIDQLGIHFNKMADHIDQQWKGLKQSDETRREMVANVSHDLRTPLATLNGYLETLLIKKDALSESEKTEYLETALRQSGQLGSLIEELFELARLDSYEKLMNTAPFSIGELVQDVLQKFKLPAQQKEIQLQADFEKRIPLVVGDIGMIQRVLENLIENAMRHTPRGGRIEMSLGEASSSDEKKRVVVNIFDNGSGISPGDLPHIFDRFYRQQKSRHEGKHAGLGLAIVKRILELHGGKVTAESGANQGTRFTFDLPTPSP